MTLRAVVLILAGWSGAALLMVWGWSRLKRPERALVDRVQRAEAERDAAELRVQRAKAERDEAEKRYEALLDAMAQTLDKEVRFGPAIEAARRRNQHRGSRA